MTLATNATNAHAQDFSVKDELLLPILLPFAQCTRLLHAPRNAWCFRSVCSTRTVCRSHQQQSSPPPCSKHPPHRSRSHREDHFLVGLRYKSWCGTFIILSCILCALPSLSLIWRFIVHQADIKGRRRLWLCYRRIIKTRRTSTNEQRNSVDNFQCFKE